MKIINKSIPELQSPLAVKTYSPAVSFSKDGSMKINIGAVEKFGFKKEDIIHFAEEKKKLFMFVNNEDTNGYALRVQHKNSASLRLTNKALIKYISEIINHQVPCRFYLQKTDKTIQKGKVVYEILTDKPINSIGK